MRRTIGIVIILWMVSQVLGAQQTNVLGEKPVMSQKEWGFLFDDARTVWLFSGFRGGLQGYLRQLPFGFLSAGMNENDSKGHRGA